MQEPPKVIIDTSTFVAAYLSKSQTSGPKMVLQRWVDGYFTLVMSPQLLEELVLKLDEKSIPEDVIEELVSDIQARALNISGNYHTDFLNDVDPKDNIVLAAALEASADYIVTLDGKHLIPIKYFHGTYIVYPNSFLRAIQVGKKKQLTLNVTFKASISRRSVTILFEP